MSIATASSSAANAFETWWDDEEESWSPEPPTSRLGINQELGDWSDGEEEESWWDDVEEDWSPEPPTSWLGINQELGDWSDGEEEETTTTCWTGMRNAVLRRYRKLYMRREDSLEQK